jgi:hypothetical protein
VDDDLALMPAMNVAVLGELLLWCARDDAWLDVRFCLAERRVSEECRDAYAHDCA